MYMYMHIFLYKYFSVHIQTYICPCKYLAGGEVELGEMEAQQKLVIRLLHIEGFV